VTRLAEQAARLHAGHYPARFSYRSVYGDMTAVTRAGQSSFGQALATLAFSADNRPG
jgi:hypothetical protein